MDGSASESDGSITKRSVESKSKVLDLELDLELELGVAKLQPNKLSLALQVQRVLACHFLPEPRPDRG